MKFNNISLLLAFLAVSSLTAVVNGQTKSAEAPAAVDDTPVVTLLDPGKGAKAPLRLKIEKGLTQTMVMEMSMNMSLELGDQKVPTQVLPAQKMTMDIHVTDVSAAGDISYDFKLSKVEIVKNEKTPAFVIKAMEQAIGLMEGISGSTVVSRRGIAKKTDVNIPENVPPQVRQMLENMQQSAKQLSAPLPIEDVGVGAKWQVVQNLTSGGIKLKQTTISELVSLKGDLAKMKFSVKQKAPAQDIRSPGTPAGFTMRLVELKSTGSGDSTLNLRRIVPQDSKFDLSSNSKMEVDAGDRKQTMNMVMKMKVKISEP